MARGPESRRLHMVGGQKVFVQTENDYHPWFNLHAWPEGNIKKRRKIIRCVCIKYISNEEHMRAGVNYLFHIDS